MKNKTKINLIIGAVAVLAIMLVVSFFKIDGLVANKKLSNSNYGIGAISAEGKVIESKLSFYTKDLLTVEGSEVTLKDDATITYRVFFYDEDEKFLSATEELNENLSEEDIVEGAKFFRVMITPADIDGEDVVCSKTNRAKYVEQIIISIAKSK